MTVIRRYLRTNLGIWIHLSVDVLGVIFVSGAEVRLSLPRLYTPINVSFLPCARPPACNSHLVGIVSLIMHLWMKVITCTVQTWKHTVFIWNYCFFERFVYAGKHSSTRSLIEIRRSNSSHIVCNLSFLLFYWLLVRTQTLRARHVTGYFAFNLVYNHACSVFVVYY
jgi:hypothetical protein